MASRDLSDSASRVQAALRRLGAELQVVELPSSTRTAVEAAQTLGCEVGQIAKSIVFRGEESGMPLLVIVSGANRVDEIRIEALMGETIGLADADFVRAETGFAIGGVPPIGHAKKMVTYIDEDLTNYEVLWAAAGTPCAVFRLTPQDLSRLSQGRVIRVK